MPVMRSLEKSMRRIAARDRYDSSLGKPPRSKESTQAASRAFFELIFQDGWGRGSPSPQFVVRWGLAGTEQDAWSTRLPATQVRSLTRKAP